MANSETDIIAVKHEGVDWISVAYDSDRLAGSCERSNEPSGSLKVRNFLTSEANISFSRSSNAP
jgi:hypothetical protein